MSFIYKTKMFYEGLTTYIILCHKLKPSKIQGKVQVNQKLNQIANYINPNVSEVTKAQLLSCGNHKSQFENNKNMKLWLFAFMSLAKLQSHRLKKIIPSHHIRTSSVFLFKTHNNFWLNPNEVYYRTYFLNVQFSWISLVSN